MLRLLIVLLTLSSTVSWSAQPGSQADARLELKTERVVVFKDGYALFIKSAGGTADEQGRLFTEKVPDGAVLGCFWAHSEKQALRSMTAEIHKETAKAEDRSCLTILELLRSNVGRTVRLGLTTGTLHGTLSEVLDAPPLPRPESTPAGGVPRAGLHGSFVESPAVPDEPGRPGTVRQMMTPRGGELIVIDTSDSSRVAIPTSEVRSVTAFDLNTRASQTEEITTRTKRLVFDFGSGAGSKRVDFRLFYFTEGVRWIPTYRLAGELSSTGMLDLQGEILNEAEDIENAALDLVVGVPSFRFRNTVSPLSLERTMRTALANAAPGIMARQSMVSNAMFSQSAGRMSESTSDSGGEPVYAAPDMSGAGQQDLFVYSVGDMTIKKSARAAIPIWNSEVPIRHLYTYDTLVNRGNQQPRTPNSGMPQEQPDNESPLDLNTEKVWHQLELKNTGKIPWTTGAALVIRGMVPVSQNLLTYTSVNSTTLLPLTVATDIRAVREEQEVGRLAGAIRQNNWDLSKVSKKGKVTLTNHRAEASRIRVKVEFGGHADSASDSGKIEIDDYRREDWDTDNSTSLNNHSRITWELTLEPGEKKDLSYDCSFYVR